MPAAVVYHNDIAETPILRSEPLVGDPISSAVPREDGKMIPGVVFILTFSGIGTSPVVQITSPNKYALEVLQVSGALTRAITPGANHQGTILPGWNITVRGTVANGQKVAIFSGVRMYPHDEDLDKDGSLSAGNPEGKRYSEADGPDDPGLEQDAEWVDGEGYRGAFIIKNTSGEDWADAILKYLPYGLLVDVSGKGLSFGEVIADTVTELPDGQRIAERDITFANYNAGTNRIDVIFAGSTVNVIEIGANDPAIPSTQLKRDGATLYRITTAGLDGYTFKIDPNATNSDQQKLWVFAPRFGEITYDIGNAADEDEWTNDQIDLTDANGIVGVVENNGEVKVWQRATVQAGSPNRISPFPIAPVVIADAGGSFVN